MVENEEDMGVAASPPGCQASPSAASADATASSQSGIPNAECGGKRSYSSHGWALKALKKEARRDGRESGGRGPLGVYPCNACGGWHLGRGYHSDRPRHKRREATEVPEGPSLGARAFAAAQKIAKKRFPNGANASQLAQVLREVLASAAGARSAKTPKSGLVRRTPERPPKGVTPNLNVSPTSDPTT